MCTINLKTVLLDNPDPGPLYWDEKTDCTAGPPCTDQTGITNPAQVPPGDILTGAWSTQTTLDLTGLTCGLYTLAVSTVSNPCNATGCFSCILVTFEVEQVPEQACSLSTTLCDKGAGNCDQADMLDVMQFIADAACITTPTTDGGGNITKADLDLLFGFNDDPIDFLGGTYTDIDVDCTGGTPSATEQVFTGTISGNTSPIETTGANKGYFNPCGIGAGMYSLTFTISNEDAATAPCDTCETSFTIDIEVIDNPDPGTAKSPAPILCNA